jgi:hypothetical protein
MFKRRATAIAEKKKKMKGKKKFLLFDTINEN